MTDHITLPRAVVEKVRQALEVASMRFFLLASYSDVSVNGVKPSTGHAEATTALATLDAALAEPEQIHTCGPDCQKPLCANRRREIAAAVEAEREAICPIVYGLCVSDNNAQEIVNAIRARGSK